MTVSRSHLPGRWPRRRIPASLLRPAVHPARAAGFALPLLWPSGTRRAAQQQISQPKHNTGRLRNVYIKEGKRLDAFT